MWDFIARSATIRNGVGVNVFIETLDNMLNVLTNNDIYKGFVGVLTPVGILLCIIYFTVEMSDRVATVNFGLEILIRQFLRFLVAYALITNLDTLISGFNTLVITLNTELTSVLTAQDYFNRLIEDNNKSALMVAANLSFSAILGGLNIFVAIAFNITLQIAMLAIGIQRALNIAIKTILAPIVVPDIYKNGLNSTGIKFLKGLFADFFQTTVILIIIEVCAMVCFASSADLTGTTLFGSIICLFVVTGAVKNSSQYAHAIMSASTR